MAKGVATLLVVVVLGAFGQLAIKAGVTTLGKLSLSTIASQPVRVFTNPWVFFGFAAYALSSLLWLTLASRYPLSLIYPMISLGYVFVVFGSMVLFKDRPNAYTWIALALIVSGVSLLAKGAK